MSNFTFVSFSLHPCSHEFVFFSLTFFFCAVDAIHCPCHLVDLYLFIVICIVLSIGAAVLNLISMFHVISNLISSVGFDVGLDRPVHLDHCFAPCRCSLIIMLSPTMFQGASIIVSPSWSSCSSDSKVLFLSIHFHFQVCLQLVIFVQIIINFSGIASSCLNFVLSVVWMRTFVFI